MLSIKGHLSILQKRRKYATEGGIVSFERWRRHERNIWPALSLILYVKGKYRVYDVR